MASIANRVLAFLRVSSEAQDPANQMFEITSYLSSRGIKDVHYVSMSGSAFRRPHPLMKDTIDNLATLPEDNRPTEVVFAAVDRLCRDVNAGVEMINTLRQLGIPVRFARTPHLDAYTDDGWNEFMELLRAAELEGVNISTRSRIAWQRRVATVVQGQSMDLDNELPARQLHPNRDTPLPYHFLTLSDQKRNAYYRDNLYLIYLFGHNNATVRDILTQIRKMHKHYAPQLLEETYGIRTGARQWNFDEIFVGTDDDFANLLNVYHLGPSGPGSYDRWSADAINAVFETVLPQVSESFNNDMLFQRKEFLELVESFELGAHTGVSATPACAV